MYLIVFIVGILIGYLTRYAENLEYAKGRNRRSRTYNHRRNYNKIEYNKDEKFGSYYKVTYNKRG